MEQTGNQDLITERLDPAEMEFSMPDWGYNQTFHFEGGPETDDDFKGAGWRKFLDCVTKSPKNERAKNYIEFLTQKKLEKLQEKTK